MENAESNRMIDLIRRQLLRSRRALADHVTDVRPCAIGDGLEISLAGPLLQSVESPRASRRDGTRSKNEGFDGAMSCKSPNAFPTHQEQREFVLENPERTGPGKLSMRHAGPTEGSYDS